MAKKRENFSTATMAIVAQRAAYRCSFPGCDKLLIGPGVGAEDIVNLGQCAHIYAAAENGPRGRDSLSEEALKSPDNGIFLCYRHHKIIDSKKNFFKYPASTLLYYKALHEHKISMEIGSLQFPMLWISSIKIIKAPFLPSNLILNFARANILYGQNGTGKSLIVEILYCILTGECIPRFRNKEIEIEIHLSNKVFENIHCSIKNNRVSYSLKDKVLSFCPFSMDVVYFHEYKHTYRRQGDDIDYFCRYTNLDREQVKLMIETIDMSNGSIANELSLKTIRNKPYEKVEIMVRRRDAHHKDSHPWYFSQLSQTEQSRIMLELLINYLRNVSQYRPISFFIDSSEFYVYDDSIQNRYWSILQENSTHFQTIMTVLPRNNVTAVGLPGWNIITFSKRSNARQA